jgi:hypothetical protein
VAPLGPPFDRQATRLHVPPHACQVGCRAVHHPWCIPQHLVQRRIQQPIRQHRAVRGLQAGEDYVGAQLPQLLYVQVVHSEACRGQQEEGGQCSAGME